MQLFARLCYDPARDCEHLHAFMLLFGEISNLLCHRAQICAPSDLSCSSASIAAGLSEATWIMNHDNLYSLPKPLVTKITPSNKQEPAGTRELGRHGKKAVSERPGLAGCPLMREGGSRLPYGLLPASLLAVLIALRLLAVLWRW